MANLGFFEIDTEGEYIKLDTITGLTFTEGTKYIMQVQNAIENVIICISDIKPTKGGFVIKNLEKFDYTPISGYDIYACTNGSYGANINIAN